jgi:hypothetical protein
MRFFACAWFVVVWWVSCGYEDPSYEGVVFACDSLNACPPGQMCVRGKCAGDPTPPVGGQVGVVCGTATCAIGSSCCDDFVDPSRCFQGASDSCLGLVLACDGGEDCSSGQKCCYSGDTACSDTPCAIQVCSSAAECPSATPNCCSTPAFSFKRCQTTACFL